jgi:spore germination cell wall hydrolase CwlJ-like protein
MHKHEEKSVFKAFLYGMGFGAFLMFVLLFPTKVNAFDENNDIYCMAQNIYFEAGNQPLAGKIAVAQVVLNRLEHPNYPTTMCDVIYQAKWKENWLGKMVPIRNQCQFSWFCDGKSDDPVDSPTWMLSLHVARDVVQGKYGDITEGSTHYHSIYVHPYWADSLNETVVINEHVFYK